jgi:hypothetical protein
MSNASKGEAAQRKQKQLFQADVLPQHLLDQGSPYQGKTAPNDQRRGANLDVAKDQRMGRTSADHHRAQEGFDKPVIPDHQFTASSSSRH